MRLGQRLYNSIFPPTFELSPLERRLLEGMYPKIDWASVVFNRRLPWFMQYSFAIGVALPNAYNRHLVHVHLRQIDKLLVADRWCILVHEAFHIQQYHDLGSLQNRGWGWGYHRRFMHYYLGWYFQTLWEGYWHKKLSWREAKVQAYRQHPMERTAYWQEGLFRKHLHVFRQRSVEEFFELVPHLVCTHSRIPETPRWPFYGLALVLGLLIALSKPLLDLLLFPIAWLLGGRAPAVPPTTSSNH